MTKGIEFGDEEDEGVDRKGLKVLGRRLVTAVGKDRTWGGKSLRVKRKRCCVRQEKGVCGVESNKKDSKTRCLLALKSLIY